VGSRAQRLFCERCFRQRRILVAALILALPIQEKAPMNVNSGKLVRLIPSVVVLLQGLKPVVVLLQGLKPVVVLLQGLKPVVVLLQGLKPVVVLLQGLKPVVVLLQGLKPVVVWCGPGQLLLEIFYPR
jgi:hypothetical protein